MKKKTTRRRARARPKVAANPQPVSGSSRRLPKSSSQSQPLSARGERSLSQQLDTVVAMTGWLAKKQSSERRSLRVNRKRRKSDS